MLVLQHNCGRGYKNMVIELETALTTEASIVMFQELFIGNRKLS